RNSRAACSMTRASTKQRWWPGARRLQNGRSSCGSQQSPRAACWPIPINTSVIRVDTLMSLAHLHLLLNHFPIIGTAVGLGLFIASFVAKSDEIKEAALVILAAVALLALPAFFSGIGAQGAISKDPAVSSALIERHEGAATLALLFMEIT